MVNPSSIILIFYLEQNISVNVSKLTGLNRNFRKTDSEKTEIFQVSPKISVGSFTEIFG